VPGLPEGKTSLSEVPKSQRRGKRDLELFLHRRVRKTSRRGLGVLRLLRGVAEKISKSARARENLEVKHKEKGESTCR